MKESEKSLAEAQKMAHLGNWEWNIITDEFYGSDEAYRIFGINPKEGKITYNSFLNYVHPDDRKYVDKAIKEILDGKKLDLEYRIISGSGEERIIHTQNEVIFDIKNTPVLMRGTVQDITERKQMETMLELVARLPQENPSPVIRLSRDLIINYANPAAQVLLTDWGSAIGKEAPCNNYRIG